MSDFLVLERGSDVGGTWRDNSYPGSACDVPSHLYSFSFAPNPEWSSTFSPQEEIQEYLRDVAERRGVRPYIRFRCDRQKAEWDEPRQGWLLETSRGRLSARVLIAAPGPLSEPSIPRLAGLERFKGELFHSATWKHEHEPGRRARRGDRHGRLRDPVRAADPAACRPAARLPAHRAVDHAQTRTAAHAPRACPL